VGCARDLRKCKVEKLNLLNFTFLYYQYSKLAPAFAVMATLSASLANLICTVPLAEGLMMPSMMARLPLRRELLLHEAGIFTAPA
jgi:hypothetical protein